jgi:hypothetical protein
MQESPCFPAQLVSGGGEAAPLQKRIVTEMAQI